MKVLLVGYYGQGNFGDDLLAVVAANVVRTQIPDADIHVLSANESTSQLPFLPDVQVVHPGHRGEYDLIVHGGGGTYFDFGEHGLWQRMLNGLIRIAGPTNFVSVENLLRRLLGRARDSAKARIGLGIGVGTFTAGSPRYRNAVHSLTDFDALIVRDETSLQNLSALPVRCQPECGSDLAFLRHCWPSPPPADRIIGEPIGKLAVVLRDWPFADGENYLDHWKALLDELKTTMDVSIFAFDRHTDQQVIQRFADNDVKVWLPDEMSIASYCELLGRHDAVVSARAHGAIVANVLGLAAAVIHLEPKLNTVHQLLGRSSMLLDPFVTDLQPTLTRLAQISADAITSDADANRDKIAKWLPGAFSLARNKVDAV